MNSKTVEVPLVSELHDPPTAQQLIESVREWLQTDVLPQVEGRLQFHTRVAVNVLAMVERELELGRDQNMNYATGLAAFQCSSEAELAEKIRTGALLSQEAEVEEFVMNSVIEKLRVANSKYLRDE